MKPETLSKGLMALLPLLLASVATADPVGPYGSYEAFNHGPQYNILPAHPPVPVVAKVVDYYARPKYSFGYEVEDYYNQLSHGRWEVRDGDVVQGQYRVLLPDGRIQIVSYIADKAGYRPHIQYIGKGAHPPPPPVWAHVKIPAHLQQPHHAHIEPAIVPGPVGPAPIEILPHGPEYGHVYGGEYGYDHAFAPSNTVTNVKKNRSLLYDRTLFRRDLPKPAPKKRTIGSRTVRIINSKE